MMMYRALSRGEASAEERRSLRGVLARWASLGSERRKRRVNRIETTLDRAKSIVSISVLGLENR